MKNNSLVIQIRKTPKEIFNFILNPSNTHLWIESILEEHQNENFTKIGTIYRNKNKRGQWSEYIITAFKRNKMFVMTSKDGNYHVRYLLTPVTNNLTQLEYYEWVDQGDLEEPFVLALLEKLKRVIEL